MRFKTDENLPVEVAELLRQHQHDALSVHDQQLAGQVDPRIARVCQTENRALVTCDLDFADIRAYPPEDYHAKDESRAPVGVLNLGSNFSGTTRETTAGLATV
jgi:Domain of unknown function (DUF5615)